MLYYKFDVCSALREKGWTSYALAKKGYMTQGTFVNIKAGKMVSPDKLEAICDLLDIQPGDVLGYKRVEQEAE